MTRIVPRPLTVFHQILAYQFDLVIACLEGWEFAPARPRLEPEVRPVAQARLRLG